MQFRYKNSYGLRLYICTNEPEVCGFMTNEYKAGKMSVIKCDQCRDGYLIVRPAKNEEYFLGCTNFKKDGTGCNRNMSRSYFYSYMGIKDDTHAKPVVIKKGLDVKPNEIRPTKAIDETPAATEEPRSEQIVKAAITSKNARVQVINGQIRTILQCLSEISEHRYYGTAVLTDVLRGSHSKKIEKGGLNLVEEYGNLADTSREDVTFIIEWLIKHKYILRTRGLYPVLHPTYEGMHYSEYITVNELRSLADSIDSVSAKKPPARTKENKENAYAPWSKSEDKDLVREFNSGLSVREIADKHGRTYGAIRARLKKTGLMKNSPHRRSRH